MLARGLISPRETMHQPKLGSSSLHTHVRCAAMLTVNTLRRLESDTGARKRRRRITTRRLMTVLAAAGLAACAVGPDFKRPASVTPAAYRVPEESSGSAGGVAASASESAAGAYAQRFITGANPADEWWTVFASRDLDAVVREAIARNHTLAAAQATV